MTGLEVLRALKGDPTTKDTRSDPGLRRRVFCGNVRQRTDAGRRICQSHAPAAFENGGAVMNLFSHGNATQPFGSALARIGSRIAGFLAGADQAEPGQAMATCPPFPSCPRVMVVDDNPDHRMAVRELLLNRGINPMLAGDGAEAVALATVNQFDIILMDLQMPVLDGLAASRQIRRFELEHDRPRVPVVAYTSRATSESLLRNCGLDAVLEKPCSADALEACLERWCPA
jgi:CheY-like chemotaxis protein